MSISDKEGTEIVPVNLKRKIIDNHFHSLTNTNFRYFWLGQCVSLIGTWMQTIGQSWLVYTLTDSPLLLGIFAAMQFLPITTLSLFAGVIVDRYPKKRILLVTQGISMILALLLAVLVFTHTIRYEYLMVLAVLLGITNSIDIPARQAFLIEIAGREDLMNAIALNSVTFNLAKILGPSLGAVLMATLGAGWCFLLNGISFVAVLYGLAKIKARPFVRDRISNTMIREIKDGLQYIYRDRVLLQCVLTALVMGIFAYNYSVLLPVFVKNILHQEATIYGVLMAALGAGSIVGALTISGKNRPGPRMNIMIISSAVVGVLYILHGFTSQYIAIMFLLAGIGAFSIYFSTTVNTILQVNSRNEYRGRVMSVYSLVFSGATPIGSIFTGIAISRSGVAETFRLSGWMIVCLILLVSVVFLKTKKAAVHSNKPIM